MRMSLVAAFLSVVASGSLVACSGSVSVGADSVSASDVEAQILSQMTDADGNGPDSAQCPGDLKAEVGETLTCTATSGDQTFDIEAKVTAVDGKDISFDLTQAE